MLYHTSVILLAKPFTLHHSQSAPVQGDTSQHQNQLPELSGMAAALCLEAAKEICSLGKSYRDTFGNCRKAPLTITHCTLSAALILLHAREVKDDQPRESDFECVLSCVKTLQELSTSWTPPRRYWRSLVAMIESQKATGSKDALRQRTLHPVVSSQPEPPWQDTLSSPNNTLESAGADDFTAVVATLDEPKAQMAVPDYPDLHYDQFILDMPFWTGIQADLGSETWLWDTQGIEDVDLSLASMSRG